MEKKLVQYGKISKRLCCLLVAVTLLLQLTLPAMAVGAPAAIAQEVVEVRPPEQTAQEEEAEMPETAPLEPESGDEAPQPAEDVLDFVQNEMLSDPQSVNAQSVSDGVAKAGYAQVKLSWSALSGATAYAIHRGTDETTQGTAVASGLTATAYTDATAATGTQYWYRVDATVSGATVTGTPFQADMETGLAALKANADFAFVADGETRIFDGSSPIDRTDALAGIVGLSAGSFVVKARLNGAMSSVSPTMDVLFGLGTNNDNTKAFLTGVRNNDNPTFSARYEACTGLYSSMRNSVQYSDRKWHTIVFSSASTGQVHAAIDGNHTDNGAGGCYPNYPGFLSRTSGKANSFTIGGVKGVSSNTNGNTYQNWIGEIAYVMITDEVLTSGQAVALSAAEAANVLVTLTGTEVTPDVGATVGALTLTGGTALSLPAGLGDNNLFTIDGTTLKVGSAPLSAGTKYHVFVSGGTGEPFGFTINSKYKDVAIALSGDKTCAAPVGSVVGELTLTGTDAGNAAPALATPGAGNDNDKFEIVTTGPTHTLQVKTALTPWQAYTVVVTSGVVGAQDATFTITAQGTPGAPLVSIDSKTEVPGAGGTYPSYPQALAPLKAATSLTVTAQFMTNQPELESIFGVGNGTAGNEHFHVYAYGSSLGYEIRFGSRAGFPDIKGSVAALRSAGLNTVAFVADGATYTIKLFVNGKLMNTQQLTAETYKFLPDILNLDTVTVGKVARTGNNYPFTGTVTDLKVYTTAKSDADMIAYTAQTPSEPDFPNPDQAGSTNPFYAYDSSNSGYFRIPALLTLNNGDVMAAIDARFSGAADSPANLDTAVNFMRKGTGTWGNAFLVNNFLDYQNKDSDRGTSASFIDPQIIQLPADAAKHPNRILMLADAYPYSTGINTNPNASISGMIEVGGQHYLALTSGDRNTWASYDYYLKPNPTPTPGAAYLVIKRSDNTPSIYTTDDHFNLYENGTAKTTTQKGDGGGTVPLNIFYDTSPLKPYPTSYLWLVSSDDNGATWSAPQIIGNEQRSAQNGNFLGCGPGRGHVVQTGPHKGRVMFLVYDEGVNDEGTGNRVERASALYSDDGGETWTLGKRTTMAASNSPGKSSEAQIVELPDGTLRMFARGNSGYVGYTDSFDGGHSWESMIVDSGLAYTGNCMISTINYSGQIDGKPVLIHSAPESGSRQNGIIRVGLIEEHPGAVGMARYTINWKYRLPVQSGRFIYSCLTELDDGTIGLLYEHDVDSTVDGMNPRYREYTLAALTQYPLMNSMNLTAGQTLTPGGNISVELKLLSPLQGDLSDHTASTLAISYPGTSLPDATLAYSSISSDNMTLTYTGTLPASPDAGFGYLYQVSIPATFPVATLYGLVTAGKTGILDGTVGGNPRFAITTAAASNGTITVDSIAAAGATVTVTVTPESNCTVIPGSVTAIYGGRSAVMTKVNDTTYTFVMPDAPVTVNALFLDSTPVVGTAKAGYAQVKVAWPAQAGATFALYRATSQAGFTTTALATGLTTNTYLDTGLTTNVHYWYRVDVTKGGNTVTGTPFQADLATGVDAFKQNAVVYEDFSGDTAFNGTRRVDLSAKLPAIKAVTKGTILMQYRYTGTPPASNALNPTLLSMPNSDSAAGKQFAFSLTSNTLRYEWVDGLNSWAGPAGATDDGRWHTSALVDGSTLIFAALDGGGWGKFENTKWDGFLSRVPNPAGFYVGGVPDGYTVNGYNGVGYTKWVGDIAYLVISDEVLTEEQANAITRAEQEKFPVFTLSGNAVTTGVANATVGTIATVGAGTSATVPTLAAKSAANNNDLFAIQGDKLVATSALTFGTTYTVEVTGTATSGTFTSKLTVNVLKGERPFYRNDASGSNNFRIPALLTLQNGDIMAAIDARFGGNSDSANNLDTAVNFKRTGDNHWGLATVPNNFLDFPNSNSGRQLNSTSFIDPAIIQDTMGANAGRIYMLVDLFPYNGGIQGGECLADTGYVKVGGVDYLALTTGNRTVLSTFGYYLKPNPDGAAHEKYQILAVADSAPTGYTTDDHFNLYQNGVAVTTTQGSTGITIATNIFFKDAPYQVFPTSYLWLISSDDNGNTWNAPQIIGNNQRKGSDGKFLGVGPGRGLEVQTGTYAGRILFPLYDHGGSMGERARVIYSDDGVTWTLGGQTTMASTNSPGKSSEAQVVELPDGTLRMYARSSTNCIGYTDSFDGGATWEPMVQDLNLPYGGAGNGCQISVINYSTLIDGKPALVLSAPYVPGGGSPNRQDGAIRIGLIEENAGVTGMGKYTVNWKYQYNVNGTYANDGVGKPYAYSCLTELSNGDIAVLYEADLGDSIIGEAVPYQTFTLNTLTKGGLVSLGGKNPTYNPGDTLEVQLTVDRAVNISASTASALTIEYPGTSFPNSTLAYTGISSDNQTLTFSGALPAAANGYAYRVSLPSTLVLKGSDGTRIQFVSALTLAGTAGVISQLPTMTIVPRYSSNRITFVEGAQVPTTYEVQRGETLTGTYTTLTTFPSGQTSYSYIDETAGAGTRYFYRINLVGVNPGTTTGVQASHKTGIDALLETAVLSKVYTTDKVFDGSRVDVLADNTSVNTAAFNQIKAMTSGTVVTMAQVPTAPAGYTAILGTNIRLCFLGVGNNSRGELRFSFTANRANVAGSNFAGAGYHTGVYTYTGSNLTAALDGTAYTNTLANVFFGAETGLTTITVGGTKDGSTLEQVFSGKIAYVLITSEVLSQAEATALSQCTDFPASDTHPDITPGQSFTGMYNNNPDNTWAFTGGTAAQGTFADNKGTRSYMGHFEEYIRWTKAGSTQISRQRHVMGAAKVGQDIQATLAGFDTRIAPLDPRAVVYLVGQEDWSKGQAGIEGFKTSLTALIAKTRALRGGAGLFAVQTPYAVANAADNANAALYAQAAQDVIAAMQSDMANLMVVDHYAQTNNAAFKAGSVNANGTLNPKGHLELGRQLSLALFGSDSGYPTTPAPAANFPNDQIPAALPDSYVSQPATVTAAANSLAVIIPDAVAVTNWRYTVALSTYTLEGLATGKTFTITDLPAGAAYTLTLTAGDGSVGLPIMTGTITSGNVGTTRPAAPLTAQQQAIDTLVKGADPLTWIFTGDSITHGAKWLLGYDSVAQSVEKFLKDDLGRTGDIVINTGNSGANTRDITGNLHQRITKFNPDVVVVMIGTNDAAGKTVPVAEYKTNLETIVSAIKDAGAIAILRTPVPSSASGRGENFPEYITALKEVAANHADVMVIDQYALWNPMLTDQPYLWNGLFGETSNHIHPNPAGQMLMTNQFLRETGLWREDSKISNLAYQIPQTAVSSALKPLLSTTVTSISLDAGDLATRYGTILSALTLTAISETGGTYTLTGTPTGTLAMEQLPAGTYQVTVMGQHKATASQATFAIQSVTLGEVVPVVFDVLLDNRYPAELTSGSTVGTLSVSAEAPVGTYTYTLVSGDGDTDNAKFSVDGATLKIAQTLTGGRTYSIRIQATDGTHAAQTTFAITAMTAGRIFREENVVITGTNVVDLTTKPYASQVLQMTEGTIVVKYTGTTPGTFFSASNSAAGKESNHFHLYTGSASGNSADNDTLGIEVRNANGTSTFDYGGVPYRMATGRIRRVYNKTTATNTVAITADKTAGAYKIFANGTLVETITPAASTGFKFIKDIEGVNTLTLGGVIRGGAANYTGFTGTINYVEAYATPLTDAEVKALTGETAMGTYIFQAGDTANSNYFRIPSLTTLADGTVVSAIDSRHGGTQDSANNIDIAVSYSKDGGATWSSPIMPLHFDDFSDNPLKIADGSSTAVSASASYIDPILLEGTHPETGARRLFMMADAFQSGGGSGNSVEGSGFKEVNGVKYQMLKKQGDSTYDYTIRTNGVIYDKNGAPTQYSVNSRFELLDNGTPMTMKQKQANLDAALNAFSVVTTDVDVKMNIMYAGALFNPLNTSYLYLTHSDDGGVTWSDPVNLNGMVKPEDSLFYGVGPGRGLQIKNGEYAGRIVFNVYEIKAPRANQCRVIYSDDFGATWTSGDVIALGDAPSMTESQTVEMPDGSLRLFARTTGGKTAMSASFDGGVTWTAGALQNTLPLTGGSGCQISVINYDGLIDGKPALIFSSPIGGSRKNGIVRIGLIEENVGVSGAERYTINWNYSYTVNSAAEYFAYSCLTSLPGAIGIIYENSNIRQAVDAVRYETISLDTIKGQPTVNITAKATQGGTVSGTGNWNLGATAIVAATPGTGYAFTAWKDESGAVVSTAATYSFTATRGRMLTAYFEVRVDTTSPSAPTNLTVGDITQSSATARWTASTDDVGVAGYEVYLNGVRTDTVAATEYRFTGLTGDTAYTVKVVALDVAGNRSSEAAVSFRTTKETILTGHVYYHDGTPASGLTVKIYKGAELVKQGVTSADGTYALTCFWGVYMLSVQVSEGVSYSLPVTLPTGQPVEITLPEGKLGSSMAVEEGAQIPPVAVDGLNNLFDAMDKALVKSNPNYRVSYELGLAEAKVQSEIDAIQSAAGGKTVSTLLDITLAKTTVTGTTVTVNIPDSGRLLQIILPIDAAWQNKSLTVYRYHDGGVDTITAQKNGNGEFFETTGGQLILHVKKFSTYAVAYSEGSTGGNPGGGSTSGSVGQFTITAVAEGGGKITPASTKADKGASVVLTIKPDSGMNLRQLLLDGRSVSVAGPDEKGVYTYTLKNIQGNHVLKAVFMSEADDVLKEFVDLSNHWARDAIRFAVEAGVMKGTGGTTFSPNGQTDRATIAMILYRMAGEPKVEGNSTFTDVPEGAWYASAVTWCAKQGIIQGAGKNLYAPNRPVTRQELAVFFYRYAAFAGGITTGNAVKMDSYSDSTQVSAWAREAMAWCVESGILGGSDNGRLLPASEATRGELAVILQRLNTFLGK